MHKKLLVLAGVLALVFAGLAVAYVVVAPDAPAGRLDTELAGVTVITPTEESPPPPPATEPTAPTSVLTETEPSPPPEPEEGPCWTEFGGDPQRSLARVDIDLGRPGKPLWARGLGSYLEYPPSFCDGTLYINTNDGLTLALDADTGRILWKQQGGVHASTPAIAGSRLIVSSHDGSVAGLDRATGKTLWTLQTDAKVESSPVAIGDTAYFGATDGRLFAVDVASGEVRWAYDTGGRINSSPSIWENRICISTYAGSVFCLDRRDGSKLWSTYVKRDAIQYESFYASASTDGERLYTMARTGKVVAFDAKTGEVLWTQHVGALGYSTPAIAHGMVFVGGYDGALHAYRTETGELVWESYVGGRVLAPALVVGDLVFFSTLTATYGARVADGKVVWKYNVGKYAPGIATDKRYYFSLNGLLVAFPGRTTGT